jgi:hypothetical protein
MPVETQFDDSTGSMASDAILRQCHHRHIPDRCYVSSRWRLHVSEIDFCEDDPENSMMRRSWSVVVLTVSLVVVVVAAFLFQYGGCCCTSSDLEHLW